MVNIHEAKARLSEIVEAATRGEHVLICNRNRPVAQLQPIAQPPTQPRPIGLAASQFSVPDSFFEPLPEELLTAFSGPPFTIPSAQPAAAPVAENPPAATGDSRTSRARRPRPSTRSSS